MGRSDPRRGRSPDDAPERPGGAAVPEPWASLLVACWALAAFAAFLADSPELATPISAFFVGDGIHFFSHGRALAAGETVDAGLPFRPPLVGWLWAGLWAVFGDPRAVALAGKGLVALITAGGYVVFYRLIRHRLPHAFWICLALPLCFGELLLAASPNSETFYRLALLAILAAGLDRPLVAGGLSGVACLIRAEHLPFALAVALALAVARRDWRRPVALATLAMVAVLVPWTATTHQRLSDYNREHAQSLPEPLPTLVPVSFYGPLNFALAQREESIHFERRTLPPPPGDPTSLDPTYPPHHEAVVHGYRLGLTAIAEDPWRFASRSLAKLGHSLRAFGQGWTWRDLPSDGTWVRRPVDLAHSPSTPWLLVQLALIGLGAWTLRRQRAFLAVGAVLVAYRLAVNVVFFPYLRSMEIVAPFWIALLVTGATAALAGLVHLVRRRPRPDATAERLAWRTVAAAILLLGAWHLLVAPTSHRFTLAGERDEAGQIIDDRTVEITLRR